MTSTVYAVGGGFEDWAYGGGWDHGRDASMQACTPTTAPALPDDFFTRVDSSQVRSAVYLIETHDNKHPKESSYGGRTIIK